MSWMDEWTYYFNLGRIFIKYKKKIVEGEGQNVMDRQMDFNLVSRIFIEF